MSQGRANRNNYKRKKKDAKLVELEQRLIALAEGERLQLAQELHDGPMQALHTLILEIAAFRNTADSEVETQFTSIEEKVRQVIQALRVIAREQRPPALAPLGLGKAILDHTRHLVKSDPDLAFHLNLVPDGQLLPEPVRLGLFRIYQVAISNVIRHAQAKWVEVHLSLDDESVTLSVLDHGCGFQVPEHWMELAQQGHLGLIGAVERVEAIGGNLEAISSLGKGTLVRAVVARLPG